MYLVCVGAKLITIGLGHAILDKDLLYVRQTGRHIRSHAMESVNSQISNALFEIGQVIETFFGVYKWK